MLGNKGSKKRYRDGGVRGGRDQFSWDQVKTDKHRENYLGHSAMIQVGRYNQSRDIFWYQKAKKSEDVALEEEKEKMRMADDELINQALGIKAPTRPAMASGSRTNDHVTSDDKEVSRERSSSSSSSDSSTSHKKSKKHKHKHKHKHKSKKNKKDKK